MTDVDPAPAETPEPPATPPPEGWVPPYILRNKGCPIVLYRLENEALPEIDADDEDATQPTRKAWLRFTANHVADIEDAFDGIVARVPIVEERKVMDAQGQPIKGPAGYETEDIIVGYEERVFYGVDAFQTALSQKTGRTIRKVFSIALDMDEQAVGLAMDTSRSQEYQTAVGVAWAIAQGVDPTEAAKILRQGLAAVEEGRAAMVSQLQKMMAPAAASTAIPPGETGSPPGAPSDGQ